ANSVVVPALPVVFLQRDLRLRRRRTLWQDGYRYFVLSQGHRRYVRNFFLLSGNAFQRTGEDKLAIVVSGRDLGVFLIWVRDSGKGELRVPPGELSIAEPRVQRDPVAGVFGNLQAVMHRVGCAWRNQMDIDHGSR